MVESYKQYQLYYRDPKTRSFVPLEYQDHKYKIVFQVFQSTITPSRIDITKTDPLKIWERSGRKQNRSNTIRQIKL